MDFFEQNIFLGEIDNFSINLESLDSNQSNFLLFSNQKIKQSNQIDWNNNEDQSLSLENNKLNQQDKKNVTKGMSIEKSDLRKFQTVVSSVKDSIKEPKSFNKNKQSKRIGKVPKNDTKNIPKNFGKAIIAFIIKKNDLVLKIAKQMNIDIEQLSQELFKNKNKLNTIESLRWLWRDHKNAKLLRILSQMFLKKHSMNYIFNSRVWNYKSHVKYLNRMREGLRNPNSFDYIKSF